MNYADDAIALEATRYALVATFAGDRCLVNTSASLDTIWSGWPRMGCQKSYTNPVVYRQMGYKWDCLHWIKPPSRP